MKIFGFQKYNPTTDDLRRDSLILFVENKDGNGVSIFLPWMVHGEYYGLCSNVERYGWRCARLNVIFNLKMIGPDGEPSGKKKLIQLIFYLEEI